MEQFEIPGVTGDWDTGMLRLVADPQRVSELIPPRRGPVQGPAVWWPPEEQPEVAASVVSQQRAVAEPSAGSSSAGRSSAGSSSAGISSAGTSSAGRSSPGSASAAMAAATLVSRISGMFGQLLQAAALGSSVLATTFTVGNTLPNMIYFLLIGGALNAVFVPQLVAATRRDPDGGAAYVDRLLTLVFCALLAVTALAMAAAPWIVAASAGGLHPEQRDLAVAFTRYCLPQIFFYGVFATVGQVLGARGRFGPTAWAPVLNNVVVIAVFAGFIAVGGTGGGDTLTPAQSMFLGVGTTSGVAVQAVIVLWFLRRAGIRFRPRFDWRGAGLGAAGSLAKWTLAYMLIGQAVNILVMHLASAVDAKAAAEHLTSAVGYAAYSRAQQVWILPQSVITVSLLTLLLPRMSRAAAEDDPAAVRDDLSFGLRMSGTVIVPCAFAFLALGPQIAAVLFGHGKTHPEQAQGIGYMLAAFGLGLVPFSAQYVILRGFYAFGDTRTPFTVGLVTGAVNAAVAITASLTLGDTHWPVVVMAGGYGLSAAAGLTWSVRRLRPRLTARAAAPGRGVARVYRRLVAVAALAALIDRCAAQNVHRLFGDALAGSLLAAAAGGGVLAGVYVLSAKALRITEVDVLTRHLRRRFAALTGH
ncbi:murein biosynthesis integral membrane protein MurJ [Catenulispora subtropica]|uniref:Integral membrane protein MviN n=1 Tax=Catenulispora subtropica TaxID=450798 RepID=A0ABN2S8W8_9ACTN